MKNIFSRELLLYTFGLMVFTIAIPEFLSLIFNGIKLGDTPDFGLGLFSLVVSVALSFNVARRTTYFNDDLPVKLLTLNFLYLCLTLVCTFFIYGWNCMERIPVILMIIITLSTVLGRLFNIAESEKTEQS